jgi:hypothetical protein
MAERIFAGDLERISRPTRRAGDALAPVGPVAQRILSLQATAGNAAVASVVQRAPKKKQPAWVSGAQSTLGKMFPKDPLLKKVVIKDYADLNATLLSMGFAAWTNSKTEIFIKDPAQFATNPALAAAVLQYILQHEANHVRQFAKAKGPPKLWETMATYEIEAYTNDIAWLAGAGASVVTDPTQHKEVLDEATKNLKDVQDTIKGAGTLTGKARNKFFFDEIKSRNLIPANSPADPRALYKNP